MMRKILLIGLVCFSGALLWAQPSKKMHAIHAFEQERYAALIQKDLAALSDMLADDLVYTHSNTTVEDKAAYLDALKTGKYSFKAFQTDSTEYHFYGKRIVVAAGIATMQGMRYQSEFKLKARFTAVYVRKHRRWQLAAWQTTKFP